VSNLIGRNENSMSTASTSSDKFQPLEMTPTFRTTWDRCGLANKVGTNQVENEAELQLGHSSWLSCLQTRPRSLKSPVDQLASQMEHSLHLDHR
jgi:hypothetical protein